MRYLLDTHAVLWMRGNNPRLNRNKWDRMINIKVNVVVAMMIRT